MKFLVEAAAAAEHAIAQRIEDELAKNKQVLWLVSGGSNVALEVNIMRSLKEKIANKLQNLTILPMDERYGKPGHVNSNTEFMRKSGFQPGVAEWIDVLAHDVSLEETLEYYADVAAEAMADAHIIIGQFGLGADGHVAGILPDSPATDEDYATVIGYEWSDYVRLTLSPRALTDVQVAYVPAYGQSKEAALKRLQLNEEPLDQLPAGLLYEIPEVYVYVDNDISHALAKTERALF
ncbi:MAG: 6-phosphogluconolactonase [Candidatus Saccharimonadales bacterium]